MRYILFGIIASLAAIILAPTAMKLGNDMMDYFKKILKGEDDE